MGFFTPSKEDLEHKLMKKISRMIKESPNDWQCVHSYSDSNYTFTNDVVELEVRVSDASNGKVVVIDHADDTQMAFRYKDADEYAKVLERYISYDTDMHRVKYFIKLINKRIDDE